MKKINLLTQSLIAFIAIISMQASQAQYKALDPNDEDDPYAEKFWNEADVKIPTGAPSSDLKPFYVSPNTPLTFSIDAQSLTFDKDEVIRYIVVITSPSGAKQVTYEGIRCEKNEWRLYATMQSDNKWVKSPTSRWQVIAGGNYNRYHAALVQDAFCENGIPRRKPKDILGLLKP